MWHVPFMKYSVSGPINICQFYEKILPLYFYGKLRRIFIIIINLVTFACRMFSNFHADVHCHFVVCVC